MKLNHTNLAVDDVPAARQSIVPVLSPVGASPEALRTAPPTNPSKATCTATARCATPHPAQTDPFR